MSKLDVSLQRSWDGNKLLGIRLLFTGKRIPEHSQPYEALYVWSVLPQPLAWFTANIGLHHIHHLSSRIPFYRLPDVLRRWRELDQAISLTLVESLRCVTLALWDEESHKLVPFRAINTVFDRDIAGQKDHEPVRHRVNRRGRSRVPPRALPRRRGGTGSDKRTMGWVNDLVDGSRDREDRGEKIIAAGPIPPIAAGPLPPKDGEDI